MGAGEKVAGKSNLTANSAEKSGAKSENFVPNSNLGAVAENSAQNAAGNSAENPYENALFVANKPRGMLCSRFLAALKKRYGVKKAGFSGTLDPFASGALIIGFGDATRLFRFLQKSPKLYRATLWLGAISETLDYTGIRTDFGNAKNERKTPRKNAANSNLNDNADGAKSNLNASGANSNLGADGENSRENHGESYGVREVREFSLRELADAAAALVGDVRFTPPKFSAKRVGGQRAYDLARRGAEFALGECQMRVFTAKILHYAHPFVTFEVEVSEGGFVRSWGQLFCERLGVAGALSALRRLREGRFAFDGQRRLNAREFLSVEFNACRFGAAEFAVGKKLYAGDFERAQAGVWAVDLGERLAVVEIGGDGRARYILNGVKM